MTYLVTYWIERWAGAVWRGLLAFISCWYYWIPNGALVISDMTRHQPTSLRLANEGGVASKHDYRWASKPDRYTPSSTNLYCLCALIHSQLR